ncbi:MAG: isochorismatase family protein [Bdellovibrio sp.]
MKSLRFLMSSDQLELLLAFEERKGLSKLAEAMSRDPSVVSRGLQRIAEEFPVLVKVKGKWELTPLGRKINDSTRAFLSEQKALMSSVQTKSESKKTSLTPKTVLVIINAQQGLLDTTQQGRNNSEAEKNIESLLRQWRSKQMPIIHVKHVSDNPSSVFYRQSSGCNFLSCAEPLESEKIVEKTRSSSFVETTLEDLLKTMEADHIVLAGFTANECIDATARDASALGFLSYVVGDATAMFDMKAADGKLLKAERIHKLTLANIEAFYAKVVSTSDLI